MFYSWLFFLFLFIYLFCEQNKQQKVAKIIYGFYLSLPEISANMAPVTNQKSVVEINIDRGSKIHLPCNIQGNPLPVFTWVYNVSKHSCKCPLTLFSVCSGCSWYRVSDSGSFYPVPSSQRVLPSQSLLFIRSVDDRDAGRWVSFLT